MSSKPENIRTPVSYTKNEKGLKSSIEARASTLQKSCSQYLKDLAREDLFKAQDEEDKCVELFNLILGKQRIIPKQIIKDGAPQILKKVK